MKKKTVLIILGVAGALGIGYTIWWVMQQINLLNQITYASRGVTLQTMTDSSITLTAGLLITNPSDISAIIRANGTYADLYVNGAFAAQAKLAADVTVIANGSSLISLSVNINPNAVISIGNVVSLFTGGISVDILGYLTVSDGLVSVAIPISYTTTVL